MSEPSPSGRRSRSWLGWGVVGVLAIAVVGSFALSSDDEVAGDQKRGPRVTPVSAAPVTRGPITERGHYPGELDADAADISSFYTGRLLAVNVRVGSTVARGDVIAKLDPVDAHVHCEQPPGVERGDVGRVGVELAGIVPALGDRP
ncbi:MAG: efflux RND transporter periplasmic adaptor subunit, partial [Deltaproteobacteria bacterium]|nr:efflux RND transporter periplasmic adaptor subunit [Kofleriaceae bacterium]